MCRSKSDLENFIRQATTAEVCLEQGRRARGWNEGKKH